MGPDRWAGFSDDELLDLDCALAVEDQEYDCHNRELWGEIRDEIKRREGITVER